MIDNKRITAIDSARGIALLLVIFGHCFRPNMCNNFAWCDFAYSYVYSFHVSLLFILSGISYALTKQKNIGVNTVNYIKKKAKNILLPWFSYSVLIYLIFVSAALIKPLAAVLRQSDYGVVPIKSYVFDMLKNENPYSFHLWYLQALFLFVLFTYLIDKYTQKNAFAIKIVLIAVMPAFYSLFCNNMPWVFKGFFQKYYFFLLGSIIPIEKINKNKKIFSVLGLLAAVALAFSVSGKMNLFYKNRIIGTITFYLINLIVILTCLGIISLCFYIRQENSPIAKIGKKSMLFYIYHQPFCCAFLGILLYDRLQLPAITTVIVCFVFSLIIPYLISKVARIKWIKSVFTLIGLPY